MRPDSLRDVISWFWRHASKDASFPTRINGLLRFLSEGRSIAKETMTAHCEVGEMLARRLGFPEEIQRAVRFSLEHWDGSGPVYGMKGRKSL